MIDELFAKSTALVRVLDGFFITNPRKADTLDDDANAFMVEVGHDNWRGNQYTLLG